MTVSSNPCADLKPNVAKLLRHAALGLGSDRDNPVLGPGYEMIDNEDLNFINNMRCGRERSWPTARSIEHNRSLGVSLGGCGCSQTQCLAREPTILVLRPTMVDLEDSKKDLHRRVEISVFILPYKNRCVNGAVRILVPAAKLFASLLQAEAITWRLKGGGMHDRTILSLLVIRIPVC